MSVFYASWFCTILNTNVNFIVLLYKRSKCLFPTIIVILFTYFLDSDILLLNIYQFPQTCSEWMPVFSLDIHVTNLLSENYYIYIYAFSRRFYPKRLSEHSGNTFVLSVCVFPGNRTHNLCAADAML